MIFFKMRNLCWIVQEWLPAAYNLLNIVDILSRPLNLRAASPCMMQWTCSDARKYVSCLGCKELGPYWQHRLCLNEHDLEWSETLRASPRTNIIKGGGTINCHILTCRWSQNKPGNPLGWRAISWWPSHSSKHTVSFQAATSPHSGQSSFVSRAPGAECFSGASVLGGSKKYPIFPFITKPKIWGIFWPSIPQICFFLAFHTRNLRYFWAHFWAVLLTIWFYSILLQSHFIPGPEGCCQLSDVHSLCPDGMHAASIGV